MKKVTFELDLDEPEDKDALSAFTHWGDFFYAVWELKHNMYNKFKHRDWNTEQYAVYEDIREWLDEVFEDAYKRVD